jgi:hypothetical protein
VHQTEIKIIEPNKNRGEVADVDEGFLAAKPAEKWKKQRSAYEEAGEEEEASTERVTYRSLCKRHDERRTDIEP